MNRIMNYNSGKKIHYFKFNWIKQNKMSSINVEKYIFNESKINSDFTKNNVEIKSKCLNQSSNSNKSTNILFKKYPYNTNDTYDTYKNSEKYYMSDKIIG